MADKSTLMKVLGGIYQPDGGDIYMGDDKVVMSGPLEAKAKGIVFIHQESRQFLEHFDMTLLVNPAKRDYEINRIIGFVSELDTPAYPPLPVEPGDFVDPEFS